MNWVSSVILWVSILETQDWTVLEMGQLFQGAPSPMDSHAILSFTDHMSSSMWVQHPCYKDWERCVRPKRACEVSHLAFLRCLVLWSILISIWVPLLWMNEIADPERDRCCFVLSVNFSQRNCMPLRNLCKELAHPSRTRIRECISWRLYQQNQVSPEVLANEHRVFNLDGKNLEVHSCKT